jgi:hypothetical protein
MTPRLTTPRRSTTATYGLLLRSRKLKRKSEHAGRFGRGLEEEGQSWKAESSGKNLSQASRHPCYPPADQMKDEQQRLLDRIAAQCPEVVDLRQMALAFRTGFTDVESATAAPAVSPRGSPHTAIEFQSSPLQVLGEGISKADQAVRNRVP